MTDQVKAEVLADSDLDGAAGGLDYKLDRASIKSWSTSGDADDRPTEELTICYTEIKWTY